MLDDGWTAAVDPADGVLLSAQGMLMYLRPDEVHGLIARCARAFPGAALILDGVPPWFSDKTVKGTMRTKQGYVTPPKPWALDAAEKDRLRAIPGVAALHDLRVPRGRGVLYGALFPLLTRIRAIRDTGLTGLPIVGLRFGGG